MSISVSKSPKYTVLSSVLLQPFQLLTFLFSDCYIRFINIYTRPIFRRNGWQITNLMQIDTYVLLYNFFSEKRLVYETYFLHFPALYYFSSKVQKLNFIKIIITFNDILVIFEINQFLMILLFVYHFTVVYKINI